jgi:hypothetical protein
MHRVRAAIAERYDGSAATIHPTRIVSIHDIAPDPDITGKFLRLRQRAPLGSQYDWLARFVKQSGLRQLDLSVHVDDRAYGFIAGHVEQVDGTPTFRLKDGDPASDLSLFASFDFPVLTLTKMDMKRIAAENGFLPILQQTWFCLTPRGRAPCGTCNPCHYAVSEGMADRLPPAARVRHLLFRQIGITCRKFAKACLGRGRPTAAPGRGN